MKKYFILIFLFSSLQAHSQSLSFVLRFDQTNFALKDSTELYSITMDSINSYYRYHLDSYLDTFEVLQEHSQTSTYKVDIYFSDSSIVTKTGKKYPCIFYFCRVYENSTLIRIPDYRSIGISYDSNFRERFFSNLNSAFSYFARKLCFLDKKLLANNITNTQHLDAFDEVIVYWSSKTKDSASQKVYEILTGALLYNQKKFSRRSLPRGKKYHFNYFLINQTDSSYNADESKTDNPLKLYLSLKREGEDYLLQIDRYQTTGILEDLWKVKEVIKIPINVLENQPSIVCDAIEGNIWSYLRFNLNWQ